VIENALLSDRPLTESTRQLRTNTVDRGAATIRKYSPSRFQRLSPDKGIMEAVGSAGSVLSTRA
jgi:hypothetical protein